MKKDSSRLGNPSIDGFDTAQVIPGADRHFERIEKAKRLKQEKENLLNQNKGSFISEMNLRFYHNFSGSAWQYKRTIPKEPKLGRPSHHDLSTTRMNSLSPMASRYTTKKHDVIIILMGIHF